jgi:hypothetical protein
MPMVAQFPSWMMFVLLMMFIGPMMHRMFGGKRGPWGRFERMEAGSRDEIRRLEGELANRDAVLEDLQQRMSELESRLDFSERLLAERRDSPELPVR